VGVPLSCCEITKRISQSSSIASEYRSAARQAKGGCIMDAKAVWNYWRDVRSRGRGKMNRFVILAIAAVAWSARAPAAEVQVLSGGAIKPGLDRVAKQYKRNTGNEIKIQFETAPRIGKRLAEGEIVDVVILPPAALDEQVKAGRISTGRVRIGQVGAGVAVRSSQSNPDITTTAALKQAMLAADSIVYNTASSGQYLEKLFDRIGVGEQIKPKTTRYPTGDEVMEHLIKGTGSELGFGPVTEIKLFESRGVKFVGPLPSEIQNYTVYEAVLMTKSSSPNEGKAFLAYLATPEAKQIFVNAGIE
jgi:molybdate transport system substrate-binding protein